MSPSGVSHAAPGGASPAPKQDRQAETADQRALLRDLRHAIAHDGFAIHYEPRRSLATGALEGAEALIRWAHRRRGLVAAAGFVPFAEQSGLMGRIGGWMLSAACTEAARWSDGVTVSVTISAGQTRGGGALIGQVARALEASGLAVDRLELQLAESALTDIDADAVLALSAIRDLGAGIALDDFGAGCAGFGALRRIPLTALKLDRSLVRGLPRLAEDRAIVRAIVAASHALGLTVVADGIETEAQRDFLALIGADQGQGRLFGPAMPTAGLRPRLPSPASASTCVASG